MFNTVSHSKLNCNEIYFLQSKVLLSAESLGRWLNGKTTDEATAELENASTENSNVDVYVGLLVTRVALLTTELEARRREHSSVVGELEKSRRIVSELRKRDSGLNAELLRRDQRHLAELSRITSVLTEAQKTQLSRMAEKASVRHL